MGVLESIFRLESFFLILVGLASFATIVTLAAPVFENDKLKSRMKTVATERDKLRAQQRAQLQNTEVRLRDKKQVGLYAQLVELLNLRKIFASDASRDLLRTAGFRNENHLVTYLALRIITPIVLALLFFVYASFVFADRFGIPTRMLIGLGGMGIGYILPNVIVQNYAKKRQISIKRAWSDALDLLLICVEAGMALEPAMGRVSREIGTQSIPLAEELTLTVAELSYLQDRRKALDNLAKRTGLDTVKSVVTSLIQSERYGTPLGTALRALAQENRDTRMAEAERKAAGLGPKLTVPMILFFMPTIFVVLLTPAILQVSAYF